jgi:HD-GYP domain-containing protein (c-di-GMP phosphodiesterase class II)
MDESKSYFHNDKLKKLLRTIYDEVQSLAGLQTNSLKRSSQSDESKSYFHNDKLKKLLKTVYDEVQSLAGLQTNSLERLSQIGIALSAEKNINKLLEMIVDGARDFTNADAGTLYIVDDENKLLNFVIIQNDTLDIRIGGTSGSKIDLPPVPLEISGKPNYSNVSSFCALTGKIVNIQDVYKAEEFDFTGPRKYDEQTGYRSQSMLVIPLKNHENDIIGVLQLLNAKDSTTKEIIPFSTDYTDLVSSLASQAAVALENAQLIQDLKRLFDSFIQGIATAIDEKSPYTGGHIRRVTELTMMIARKINDTKDGKFAKVSFSEDELEELRIATWLHDVGKITTPEYIADKATKLETIFDRIDLLQTRFDLIIKDTENEYLKEKLKLLENGNADQAALQRLEEKYTEEIKSLQAEKSFIEKCNTPGENMSDEKAQLLEIIAEKTFQANGDKSRYISDEELKNLQIRRGTLTAEERKIIENHVLMSIKILQNLPFPKKLSHVPDYAGGHHEMMDGSGYPYGLKGDQLPLQARIMAIADIFESLTAKDRPYKKPMKLSETLKILSSLRQNNKIDPDVYDLFISSNLYKEYAKHELNEEQIDMDLSS